MSGPSLRAESLVAQSRGRGTALVATCTIPAIHASTDAFKSPVEADAPGGLNTMARLAARIAAKSTESDLGCSAWKAGPTPRPHIPSKAACLGPVSSRSTMR
jgi:hypothetical protein